MYCNRANKAPIPFRPFSVSLGLRAPFPVSFLSAPPPETMTESEACYSLGPSHRSFLFLRLYHAFAATAASHTSTCVGPLPIIHRRCWVCVIALIWTSGWWILTPFHHNRTRGANCCPFYDNDCDRGHCKCTRSTINSKILI